MVFVAAMVFVATMVFIAAMTFVVFHADRDIWLIGYDIFMRPVFKRYVGQKAPVSWILWKKTPFLNTR